VEKICEKLNLNKLMLKGFKFMGKKIPKKNSRVATNINQIVT
jgi:hypothetical protein